MKIIKYHMILLLLPALFCRGEKIFDLPEVFKPRGLCVRGDYLYISLGQEYRVHLYSLKGDGSPDHKLAKQGEGPGELKRAPLIFPGETSILLSSPGKVLWYTTDGTFLREARLDPNLLEVQPVGDRFVGTKFRFNDSNGTHFCDFYLLDEHLKELKLLYSAPLDAASAPVGGKFEEFKMLVHHLAAYIQEDRILVADSRRGLFFKVFDVSGLPTGLIHPRIKAEPVTPEFKERLIGQYQEHETELWPLMKDAMHFYDIFPAIRSCHPDQGFLYVTTYPLDGENRIILQLKFGSSKIKRIGIPLESWEEVVYSSRHRDLFCIHQGKAFELRENPDTETYELHVLNLLPHN